MLNAIRWTGAVLILCSFGIGAQDLQFGVYATTSSVRELAANEEARAQSLELLEKLHVTKICLEVYRGGDVMPVEQLLLLRDFFIAHKFEVVGGIATVPGGDVGVKANAGLQWFNYQNPKTREDLAQIMRTAAPLFDTFVVDDFLCTGDTSVESDQARGDRPWSTYRRDLMVSVADRILTAPARQANPSISLIVKFPQWYDLFHLYGYDVERMSPFFDRVWVGTETRGANTQRYGFVPPFEGFVNYRWIRDNAPEKTYAAWFDHGDCGAGDFIDQAWQSVLAGAPELVFFCYSNIAQGHPDHARIAEEYDSLRVLSQAVRETPVSGIPTYKPHHSEGKPYLMDFLGMMGVPIVPVCKFPGQASRIFLLEQSAADSSVAEKLSCSKNLKTIVMTVDFLAGLKDGGAMARQAGLKSVSTARPVETGEVLEGENTVTLKTPLRLYADIIPAGATVLLQALVDGKAVPFLTEYTADGRNYIVLNTYSYTEADFKKKNEWLLHPCPLGLLEVPDSWANTLRTALSGIQGDQYPDGTCLHAPTRVSFQPIDNGWFIQNYNDTPTEIKLDFVNPTALKDGFSGENIAPAAAQHVFPMSARSRIWLRP